MNNHYFVSGFCCIEKEEPPKNYVFRCLIAGSGVYKFVVAKTLHEAAEKTKRFCVESIERQQEVII